MAELLAANQITIAKVLDGEKGEMSAEQIAQLNQASSDASEAKTDASTAKTTAQTANSTAQAAQNSASQAQTKAQQALEASSVTTETLKAESARIDNLETGKANIADLNAEKARIDTLETNKADIDLANVNNAWITNGVIKDASIANEKVISVSANKLTAGTIDASKITVTNLNADNITVGTINGARIGDNSIDLDKLSQEVPTKAYLDSVEQKLQEEIDGAIETFTVNEIPTLNNEPAVNWTTDDIKSTHVGDLCYVVNNASDYDGFCYRFQYSGTVYSWALIKDNDVTKAIQDIAELGGEVTQFKTDYTSKVSEIDGGIESLKSRTTTIETTYSTKEYAEEKANEALSSANDYTDTAVSTKVETSVFNTLKNTVDENSANITSLTGTVTTKADSSTVTALSNTVNEVKQTADANSSSISNLTTTVNSKADGSKVTALENKTSTIEQNLSGVTTRVTNLESENDGLDTRLTAAESKITDDAIVSTVTSSKTYKDALSSKVDTSVYNTKMEQLDNSISLKATATDVYTKTQADAAFDAKGSAATAKSEAISSAKNYTDTATTDMATEEFVTSQGYLTVASDAITSKVSKNEVISAINQTAESVSINAEKINLNGSVTFSSFDNSLQTTINNKAETSELEGVRTIANNAQDSIDNLEIGGRNLVKRENIIALGTSFSKIDGYEYTQLVGKGAGIKFPAGMFTEDTEYVLSFKFQKVSGTLTSIAGHSTAFETLGVVINGKSFPQHWNDTHEIEDSEAIQTCVVYLRRYTASENPDTDNNLYIQPQREKYHTSNDITIKYWDIKLEKGSKATDWTPAPEDVDAGIANAAKVATNYIHADDTNGLVVNNNQTVGVGYDVQLKANGSDTGMNIRQDGNILASFLQNSVSLGKNSINSKVGMCGDKGGVSASFGYYIDSVTSNNAEPGSTLSFDFNETTFKNKVGQEVGFYDFLYTSVDGWTLFDPVNDTSYAVTLSQYGITLRTATSSLNDNAQIVINYVLDGSVKFYNADISNPVRKLELEMAENPSSSESDYANITIERQSGTYANGDGKEHSIITMMTLHEFANVATLQLFDDEISLDATHLYLNSSHGEGSIELNGTINVNGIPIKGCHKIAISTTGDAGTYTYDSISWLMHASHIIYLEEKISEQQNGIILAWSFYENGTVCDWGWNFTVIPKGFIVDNTGGGEMFTFMAETATFGNVGAKYINFRDDRILGNNDNYASGTGTSGIKYANGNFVLRWVYGF